MFSGLTLLPDYYKEKLSIFVALGPVAMIPNNTLWGNQYSVNHYGQVDDAVWMSGMHSIGSSSDPGWLSSHTKSLFCGMVPDFCFSWADGWENSDPTTDDPDRYKVACGTPHNGGETPMKSILHYGQNINEVRF